MANCSKHKNPLINSGTSQIQRILPGLDKNRYALVDEKEFADWIVFANDFAVFINYYNNSNVIAGNWKPFFSADISAQLGTIALQNIGRYQQEIKERFDFIRDDDNETALAEIRIKLNELFSAILTISKALDGYTLKLPEDTSLKQTIFNLTKTRLSPALKRLIAYYQAAQTHGYLDNSTLSNWLILNKPLTDAGQIINIDGLSKNWFDNSIYADWAAYVADIDSDESIFNNPLTAFADEFLSIEHAANHNLFTGIFDTYLSTYTKIIQEAEAELLKTLESYDAHTPHYALFLSFLMLFRFTQTHSNTITQRHLDFYYKEVLRLQPRKAEANKVHVLGELAKQVDSYLLKQGTLLKAGKDSLKKDVNYQLDADTVFNKAKVAQLKTFYKAAGDDSIKEPGTSTVKQNNNGRVFASPATNTDDGIEAKLTSANKEWQPYVHKVYKEAELERIAMPKAQLGFALASHYLYLTEGERKVFVRLVMNNNSALNGKHIECYLTAEKEWYKVESLTIASSGKKLSDGTTNCAEISFTIPGSAPAIVNYNAAKHGGTFNVALPMLKIYLVNDDASIYEYDALKDIIITQTEIRVEVGMEGSHSQNGLKNLQLSNDFGALDASKPFMPFGGMPKKDSGFVIGSKEIISKKNTAVKLNIEWAELPDAASKIKYEINDGTGTATPSCTPQMLSGGKWISNSDESSIASSTALFSGIDQKVQLFASGQVIPEGVTVNYAEDYGQLNASSVNGFVRLTLASSFGHSEYIRDLSVYLIEKTADGTDTIEVEPVEPYTPKIKSLYASYSAWCANDLLTATESDFNSREINFFHIYPFGDGEQHKYLNPAENVYLLPQFKHKDETKSHIGEFYIGIEYLNPNEGVNILFQVMEGTTNPTIAKPTEHLSWAFLSNNIWIEFKSSDYSDNTLQLVQSGIISFAIPDEATTTNTILPTGYIWLRAAVTEAAEAVCDLISVDAQATVATFVNAENADDFLNTALPAGTVAKLKIPDASVKKITQPYSSFGGRPKENDDHFYIRVSERLRHKARAITVWDYEHLVLEAFPEIYKVKCLNHTQIEDGVYHEVKPGYVSIITIPSQQNHNDANPLKPYTQQSTLTNIENFLRKRISCFVNLRACQPRFEEVRLEFSLKLFDQYKDFTFYSEKLKEEITQFLSPWAFGNTSAIDFGGKIYKSVLINFIEERYYVDFITDVFMYVTVDDTTTNESTDMDEISASTARSILVSAPASKHDIHELTLVDTNAEDNCIDKTMKITPEHG
ncbi:MAG: baseplate J/gp47 family protein [Prolixibacteraceae bacterium]|nr:baseplate J/gp47 family protein [Prolixibacteraceae bacterium]